MKKTLLGRGAACLCIFIFCLGSIPNSTGAVFDSQTTIMGPNGGEFDRFGTAVAISGDTLVVGSPQEDTSGGELAGAAHVFIRTSSGWMHQARLTASDGQASDFFGSAVAIHGNTIVVGAYADDDAGSYSGSAYVFVRSGTTWTQQAKLVSSSPGEDEQFGNSVAVFGDTIAVGSHLDDTTVVDAGAVYIFARSRSTWSLQTRILSNDTAQSAWFGIGVALDNDTLIIGSPFAGGGTAASVYVYVRSGSTWVQQARLVPDTPKLSDDVGIAIDISLDTIVAGNYRQDVAYVYERTGTTWNLVQKLLPVSSQQALAFGQRVAIDQGVIAVSLIGADNGAGAADVYVRTPSGWVHQQKVSDSPQQAGANFALSLSMDQGILVGGAPGTDSPTVTDVGTAVVFEMPSSTALDWTSSDIGSVAAAGSASFDGTTFTVRGSGADIWDRADEFQYVYDQRTGDSEILARVTSLQNTDGWAKAGIMMRGSLEAGSPHVSVYLTAGNGVAFQYRTSTAGLTTHLAAGPGTAPVFLRLVRSSNNFFAYRSANGVNWTSIGSVSVVLPSTAYVGLAVTSHRDGVLTTATYDHVSLSGSGTSSVPAPPSNLTATPVFTDRIDLSWTHNGANTSSFLIEWSQDGTNFAELASVPPTSTTFFHTGLQANTTYWYRVKARNQIGDSTWSNIASARTQSVQQLSWQSQDIGAVAAAGSFSFSNGVFRVKGSGADIWGSADEFHYVYQAQTGNVELTGRLLSLDPTDGWAKAGLMIRESLSPNSRHVFMGFAPSAGAALQYRATTGGSTVHVGGGAAPLPHWFRLARAGNVFTAYKSSDGVQWTLVSSITVEIGQSYYVGLAVTSHKDGTLTTAAFDNVLVNAGSSGTPTPPAAPTNLSATPFSSSRIDLTWTDNSNNETGFELERSTNGTQFTFLASVTSPTSTYQDLAVSAGARYWYRVRAVNGAGASAWSNLADATTPTTTTALPPPWLNRDINITSPAGSASFNSGVFTVRGAGADIWESRDSFHYAYQSVSGDVTIIGEVLTQDNTNPWAKAGFMIRESLNADAKNVAVLETPSHGPRFQWRSATAGATTAAGSQIVRSPLWLKLTRVGNTFSAYWSPDDHSWVLIGQQTISMSSTCFIGMAVTSHSSSVLGTATFRNVSVSVPQSNAPANPSNLDAFPVSGGEVRLNWVDHADNESGFLLQRSLDGNVFEDLATLPPNQTTYFDRLVTASTTYWYQIRAFNGNGASAWSGVATTTTQSAMGPGIWAYLNIGTIGVRGDVKITSGPTYHVNGSGSDIWDRGDGFLFLYQEWSGDGEIVAKVDAMENTNPWAKVGVMFRQSLSPSAANVSMVKTAEHGFGFQSRVTSGDVTTFTPGPATGPGWVRISRVGNVFTGYTSNDGVNWTAVGSKTVVMTGPIYVGMAVSSHNNAVLNHARFVSVRLAP